MPGEVILDPSRIAAQVVSGIGFIGGGLIFVRRDAVRGLTTAAGVWLTAAIGMAAGAGLPLLAVLGTAAYFVVVFVYTPMLGRLAGRSVHWSQLRLEYVDQRGVLRDALEHCGREGFAISELSVVRTADAAAGRGRDGRRDRSENTPFALSTVAVTMTVAGTGELASLVAGLSDLNDVVAASAGEPD